MISKTSSSGVAPATLLLGGLLSFISDFSPSRKADSGALADGGGRRLGSAVDNDWNLCPLDSGNKFWVISKTGSSSGMLDLITLFSITGGVGMFSLVLEGGSVVASDLDSRGAKALRAISKTGASSRISDLSPFCLAAGGGVIFSLVFEGGSVVASDLVSRRGKALWVISQQSSSSTKHSSLESLLEGWTSTPRLVGAIVVARDKPFRSRMLDFVISEYASSKSTSASLDPLPRPGWSLSLPLPFGGIVVDIDRPASRLSLKESSRNSSSNASSPLIDAGTLSSAGFLSSVFDADSTLASINNFSNLSSSAILTARLLLK